MSPIGLVPSKYEPPIPAHMAGEVANLYGKTILHDIKNFKAYPDVLIEGEMVEMTEKTHVLCVNRSHSWS